VWGPGVREDGKKYTLKYPTQSGMMELPTKEQNIYIDERSISDYEKFKQYFTEPDYDQEEF